MFLSRKKVFPHSLVISYWCAKLIMRIIANLPRAVNKPKCCQSTAVDSQKTSESAVFISAWFGKLVEKLEPNAVSFIAMDDQELGPDCA